MSVFYITLLSVFIFSLLARLARRKNEKYGVFFLIIVILILVLVSGLRSSIGDTYLYKHLYTLIEPGFNAEGYEPGFMLFFKILKKFSKDPQFMIMITSIIINVFNTITLYKFTKKNYFEIAMFLYIASGYYTVTMNGIRQSLIAAIIFYATTLIIEGKFKKYLIIILLGMTIHNSVFIMIPIYFVVREEPWSKKINILYTIILLGLFFYEPLMSLLGDSKYGDYANSTEGGANVIRIIIYIVPVILAYIKRKEIKGKCEFGNVFVNMSIICAIVMMFSVFNWIFARFTIYLELYNFILLSSIICTCFKGKERRLLYFSAVVCYCMFFYYEQVISLQMVYTSPYSLKDLLIN